VAGFDAPNTMLGVPGLKAGTDCFGLMQRQIRVPDLEQRANATKAYKALSYTLMDSEAPNQIQGNLSLFDSE
jgi:hypothetical protein